MSATVLAEPTLTEACGSLAGARAHRERGERRCEACEAVVGAQRSVREAREERAAVRARRKVTRRLPRPSVDTLTGLLEAVTAAAGAHRVAEAELAACLAVNGRRPDLVGARDAALDGERRAVRELRAALRRTGV